MGIRPNIKAPGVFAKYLEGVRALKAEPYSSSTSSATNYYDVYVETHFANIAEVHGTPMFLPWHRLFLMDFELRIQTVLNDDTFALPYWDWAGDAANPAGPNSIWVENMMGEGANPIENGPFANSTLWPTVPYSDPRISFGNTLERDLIIRQGMTSYPTNAGLDLLFNNTSYDAFRLAIEDGPHGFMHVWVGGQMAVVECSPNDPTFFLHHSNIDRLWASFDNLGYDYQPSSKLFPNFNGDSATPPTFDQIGAATVDQASVAVPTIYNYDVIFTPQLATVCVHPGSNTSGSFDQNIYTETLVASSTTWSGSTTYGGMSQSGVGITQWSNSTFLAHNGMIPDRSVYTTSYGQAGQNWLADTRMNDCSTSSRPAALSYNGVLTLAVQGSGSGDNSLWVLQYGNTSDQWISNQTPFQTDDGPALATYLNGIFMSHCGGDSDAKVWWSARADNEPFTSDQPYGGQSSYGPAMIEFQSTLYLVHVGGYGDHLLYWTTFNDETQDFNQDTPFSNGNSSTASPTLFVAKNTLYCVHRGQTTQSYDDQVIYISAFDPSSQTWSTDVALDGEPWTAVAPFCATVSTRTS